MSLVEASSIPLDTEVVVKRLPYDGIHPNGTIPMDATVIGKFYRGETCVAWNGENLINCNRVKDMIYSWRARSDRYTISKNADNFKYYNWIPADQLIEIKEEAVVSLDRKCIGCNLPAPHGKSNIPEDKFQCVSCQVLIEIGD